MSLTIQLTNSSGTGPIGLHETAIGSTAVTNASGGPCKLYAAYIDNSANAALEYIKLYDSAEPITVGTTAPTFTLTVAASQRLPYCFFEGLEFKYGLTYAAVSDGGGTAGTTTPGSSIVADFAIKKV